MHLPARLRLELTDGPGGCLVRHTLEAGFGGFARVLDPLLRLYLSPRFAADLDRHVHTEFPDSGTWSTASRSPDSEFARRPTRRRSPMLEFDAASKRFGVLAALDGCTFTAEPGRLTGFLGPNGAGKTTAMRAVFGLVELDSGAVRWRGAPIGPRERTRFGYMPEERGLYPRMRVRDQLVYLGRLCGRRARPSGRTRRHLARAARPRRAGRATGSTPSRTATSSASSSSPRWSTSPSCSCSTSRSPVSTRSPWPPCRSCSPRSPPRGATVLFSSHQLDLVEDICEDVVIIDHGRVVLAGELDELRADVPQRFVTIRYRGIAPDWSALPSVELVEQRAGEARLRVDQRRRPRRDDRRRTTRAPTSSRSPTSHRRCPSCSARRWRHERCCVRAGSSPPAEIRERSRSRAFSRRCS